MAEITAALIKRVREMTGAGMSDVKKALVEAEGDEAKAIETLRLKGAKDVGKRESRTASNGLVTAALDGPAKVLLELNCETDFVAKTEAFQQLATSLANHVAGSGVTDVQALLDSPFGGSTVKAAIDEANVALGEKLEIRRFARFESEHTASYLHKTSPDLPPTVGVLVELSGPSEVGRDIALHIASMAPKFVNRDEVPAEVVESERRLAEQIAREEGKPEQALPKIVEGRVNGFFKDFTLVEQAFVKDNKKTIAKVLEEAGVTVTRFARFKVGQA